MNSNNDKYGCIIFIFLFIILPMFFSYGSDYYSKIKTKEKQEKNEEMKKIQFGSLIQHYNALKDEDITKEISFTTDFEEAYINHGRPIFSEVMINDILKQNDNYLLKLSNIFKSKGPMVDFWVECDKNIIDSLKKIPNYEDSFYGVILQLKSFNKNKSIVSEGEILDSDTFNGKCLEIKLIQ